MNKLKQFIDKNFPKVLAKETELSLGDRSKYIGASDIGSCLRKAYLSKTEHVEHSIAQHIVFQRGHIAEQIVEKMISSTPVSKQVEVKGKAENGYEIKAHIDFTVDFTDSIVVIEAKSTSLQIDQPYESWILQVQLQMGLLMQQQKRKRKYKEIRAYIIALDVNSGWYKTFEISPNKALFDIAMSRVDILANALVSKTEPAAEVQLYCSKCAFKHDCPAITKMTEENLPADVAEIVSKLVKVKEVEKEIKEMKNQLKSFMESTKISIAKAGNNTVSLVKRRGKKTVDTDLLQQVAPDIYAQVECHGDGYSYLKVV